MKFFDLFAGVGGFRLGMQQAGHTPVGWCEYDKFAQKSYNAIYNTKGEWFKNDAREIRPEEMPDFEVLTAGFPCQSFSIAGKRGGFKDTRGTLFFEIARIARAKLPKILLLENVKGLLNHANGATFIKILQTLDELGYNAQWQVLNCKDFSTRERPTPQNRERIFIIGHLRGEPRPEVFPIRGENKATYRKSKYQPIDDYNSNLTDIFGTVRQTNASKAVRNGVKVGIIAQRGRYKDDGSIEQQAEPRKEGLTNTLTSVQKDNYLYDGFKIRQLTPKECWRLQGFPDWAFEKARQVNSDTQLYKQAGNSVTVNVIEAIARRL